MSRWGRGRCPSNDGLSPAIVFYVMHLGPIMARSCEYRDGSAVCAVCAVCVVCVCGVWCMWCVVCVRVLCGVCGVRGVWYSVVLCSAV